MPTTKSPSPLAGFDSLPNAAFVRVPTVAALRACSRATVWRHSKAGIIPAPWILSSGVTAWNVGELRSAMARSAA